jgi:hypothetical protein
MPTDDEIAAMASRGEDVSAHFTNKFTTVRPAHGATPAKESEHGDRENKCE